MIKVDFVDIFHEMIFREKRKVLKRKFFDENAFLKLFLILLNTHFANTNTHKTDEGIKTYYTANERNRLETSLAARFRPIKGEYLSVSRTPPATN